MNASANVRVTSSTGGGCVAQCVMEDGAVAVAEHGVQAGRRAVRGRGDGFQRDRAQTVAGDQCGRGVLLTLHGLITRAAGVVTALFVRYGLRPVTTPTREEHHRA
jgi:hypothetical protein